MLSLSVDVDERGASASSSRSRALVLAGGAAAVQQDHVRSHAARQPSVKPCRQARAVQVHHRGDAVWPGLTPGRPARCARADPGRPTVAPSRHGVPPGLAREAVGSTGSAWRATAVRSLKIVTICLTPACNRPRPTLPRRLAAAWLGRSRRPTDPLRSRPGTQISLSTSRRLMCDQRGGPRR